MIECSPIALYCIDLEGTVLTWNPSAERVFGWTAEEVLGRPLPIVPEDKKEEFAALRREVARGGGFRDRELVRLRRDGTLIPVTLSTAPVVAGDGQIIGIMSAAEDISGRKRAQEALQRSEERFRSIAEGAPDPIFIQTSGCFAYVNPAACRLFGAESAEDLLGTPILERVHPDYHDSARERIRRLNEGREAVHDLLEQQFVRLDGSSVWVETTGEPITYEGQNGALVFVRDISQRKESERTLRESEAKFRNLFHDHAAVKLLVNPHDGRILDANPAAAQFYGWPLEQLRRMNIGDINPLPFAELRAEMEKARNATSTRFEFRHRRADGSIADVEVFSSRVRVGEEDCLYSIVHDISEKRQLEAQLLQAQKMESVGRLAGGIAHDYNNMLSVILGYTELALSKVDSEDSLRQDLEEVFGAARRSADITRQLLAFARRQTMSPEVLDLNETVDGMLTMLRRLIGEDVNLSWVPKAGLWPVRVDPSQVHQILANLCVNARDAIDGVGSIMISTDNVRVEGPRAPNRGASAVGEYVMLEVADDGCGMSAEILQEIFEPFFTTKSQGEGTGLGLSTVYGIVQQNGGSIDVHSTVGEGATFRVYLPRWGEQAQAEEQPTEREIPRGRGETVLVVEDEVAILRLTRTILQRLGYRVLDAGTPDRAAELAESHRGAIDLLMTDVVMPEMNGRDLAERLKRCFPDLKVLFMSGYTADVIAEHGILDEGVHFLQEPFSFEELAAAIRAALD